MRLGDIDERKLTGGEKRSKEAHFKKLKKHKKDFSDRYGDEGEGIMHAIATKHAKGESVDESEKRWKQTSMSPQEAAKEFGKENVRVKKGALRNGDDMIEVFVEGYYELPPFNREKYQKRDGLEGPIPTRSGKVVYYDEKEGMYYDPDTDMYISYDDFRMLDKPSMHMVGKATSRHDDIPEADLKGFDVTSQRALRDLKQRYPHAKDPVSAMVADIEKNERDSDTADYSHEERMDDIEDRIKKLEKEIGMKENITPPGSSARQASMNVLNSLEYIVKNKSASEVKFFDGKAKIDLFTASAVLNLYNGVNDDNKKKLANLMADRQGFVKAAKIAFKMSENTEMKIDKIKNEKAEQPQDPLVEGVLDDTDEDGWMAKSQLYKLAKYAIGLHGMITDTDNLEPWIQAKITRASEDMSSVKHYLEYQAINPHHEEMPTQDPMGEATPASIGIQQNIKRGDTSIDTMRKTYAAGRKKPLTPQQRDTNFSYGKKRKSVEEDMHDVDEHKMLAKHLMDMAKEDDADEYGMDGDYFREVARAVMGHDPMEIRAAILDGDTAPREQVLDHIAQQHPDLLKEIFPRDAENEPYLATMREGEENHYLCVHAQKGTTKCTASSSYEAAKKAAAQWKMKSTAGIDAHLMGDEPKTATEGHSPHKKGTAKYKKHMAAKHASMAEGTADQLEKQAVDFFTSIKSKINTTGKK